MYESMSMYVYVYLYVKFYTKMRISLPALTSAHSNTFYTSCWLLVLKYQQRVTWNLKY